MLSYELNRKFWVSGKFPETSWGTMKHCQATHQLCLFLGSCRGTACQRIPVRQAAQTMSPSFLGFL